MPIATRPIVASLAASLLLTACTAPPIQLSARLEEGRVVVSLSQDSGIIFSRKTIPCIAEATLYDGPEASDGVAWQIRITGDVHCADIGSLIVGQAPPGFAQIWPMSRMPKGAHKLEVHGVGWGDIQLTL